MENLQDWQICDEFSVVQAALIIAGHDPAPVQEYIDKWSAENRPKGYDPAKTALIHAINAGRLPATIKHLANDTGGYIDYNNFPENYRITEDRNGKRVMYQETPDWHLTTILRSDLVDWLKQKNWVKSEFFFPTKKANILPYMDPQHPHYSSKLAIAISAWTVVNSNQNLIKGKSVKQSVINLLKQHADGFGLTKENSKLSLTAIEEIAKVVNWDPEGGAPKTPGE